MNSTPLFSVEIKLVEEMLNSNWKSNSKLFVQSRFFFEPPPTIRAVEVVTGGELEGNDGVVHYLPIPHLERRWKHISMCTFAVSIATYIAFHFQSRGSCP